MHSDLLSSLKFFTGNFGCETPFKFCLLRITFSICAVFVSPSENIIPTTVPLWAVFTPTAPNSLAVLIISSNSGLYNNSWFAQALITAPLPIKEASCRYNPSFTRETASLINGSF